MLLDIIKYFAKYPAKPAVLELFRYKSEANALYDGLKTELEALPDESIIPGITKYVFSTDSNVVDDILRDMQEYFLLLEYGRVTGSPVQQMDTRDVNANLAISVGIKHSKKADDIVMESVKMQQCMDYIIAIIKQMVIDNDDLCDWLRFNESSFHIDPIDPLFAHGCIGWTLSFTKNQSDILFS